VSSTRRTLLRVKVRSAALAATVFVLMISGGTLPARAQSAAVLLESGIYAEEAQGDPTAAIGFYAKTIAASDAERPIVAQALLRIGMCHLKNGDRAGAKGAFDTLVTKYPEQKALIERIPPATRSAPLVVEDEKARPVRIGRFLSLVLRHDPTAAGVVLDREGWVSIDALLSGASVRGFRMSRTELVDIVRADDEQRFKISEDHERIRANHGHSVPVQLGLAPLSPPETLYHGVSAQYLQSVMTTGLQRGSRQFVLLSVDIQTAACVGRTDGQPRSTILKVAADQMKATGFRFFLSENGVWMTEDVPPQYVSVVESQQVPTVCAVPVLDSAGTVVGRQQN
jgi:putative RNA 2'-phosphotransferase